MDEVLVLDEREVFNETADFFGAFGMTYSSERVRPPFDREQPKQARYEPYPCLRVPLCGRCERTTRKISILGAIQAGPGKSSRKQSLVAVATAPADAALQLVVKKQGRNVLDPTQFACGLVLTRTRKAVP